MWYVWLSSLVSGRSNNNSIYLRPICRVNQQLHHYKQFENILLRNAIHIIHGSDLSRIKWKYFTHHRYCQGKKYTIIDIHKFSCLNRICKQLSEKLALFRNIILDVLLNASLLCLLCVADTLFAYNIITNYN